MRCGEELKKKKKKKSRRNRRWVPLFFPRYFFVYIIPGKLLRDILIS